MGDGQHRSHLDLARKHLERVQAAWDEPTDWVDLTLYGFYCLENAIVAAAEALGLPIKHTHPAKADAARRLHVEHGLPDVSELLAKLNEAWKAVAYGDVDRPDLSAEDVAVALEHYVDCVAGLVEP